MARILIVEDSPTQAREIQLILETAGFETASAADGNAGWEIFDRSEFDLVLSDILMPGLSGYELCRRVKQHPTRGAVPFMLLTKLNEPQDILAGLECGADNFLTKPYEAEYLVSRVRHMLVNSSMRASQRPNQAVELFLMGKKVTIHSAKEQILDLLISTFEDYRRSKQREEELVREQREQEARAAQELAKKAEELARSNQELEHFASVASHDLRAPLRTVTNYCQLLQRRCGDQLDPQATNWISQAVQATVRMQILIEDLLAFARVNKPNMIWEPVDSAALLDRVAADLAGLIEESGGKLTRGPLPTLNSCGTYLFQIFQNLISNSLKFRGNAPPEVRVNATEQQEAWLFSVEDNGVGIDPGNTERIFRMFERLHAKSECAGSGIGLATCRKIVDLWGGRIWVHSNPGAGSTFYFTVPKAVA